jgi:putative spermidine/putrescine transport system permease protein
MNRVKSWVTYLQVAPLALVFLLFLIVPIATIVVVSFFDYNTTQIIPPSCFRTTRSCCSRR